MDKPIPMREQYPELQRIAEEIAQRIAREINERAPRVETPAPYKAQAILELLIDELEARV